MHLVEMRLEQLISLLAERFQFGYEIAITKDCSSIDPKSQIVMKVPNLQSIRAFMQFFDIALIHNK
jgi:hypothetical protein